MSSGAFETCYHALDLYNSDTGISLSALASQTQTTGNTTGICFVKQRLAALVNFSTLEHHGALVTIQAYCLRGTLNYIYMCVCVFGILCVYLFIIVWHF